MTNDELIIFIQKLEEIMVSVSTGSETIQRRNKEYQEIYYKVSAELIIRKLKNENNFSSLWDYYSYWSKNLPTYQKRREFVRELYKNIEDKLNMDKLISNVEVETEKTFQINFDDLHEEIIMKCKNHFLGKDYDDAILNALKLIEDKVRKKGKFKNEDLGVSLMDKAFGPDNTPFIISENRGEISGWQNIFKGIIGALKNPQSHRFVGINNPFEAFQILVFASYLLNFIDNLQIKQNEWDEIEIPF